MSKLISLILFLFLSYAYVGAQSKDANDDKQKLLRLEYDWLKAEFALDTAFLSSIMDPTFIGISAEGVHNKKEDLLDMYNTIAQRNKDSVFIDSFKLENAIVNLYGAAAVVTFIVHTYRKNKGIPEQRRTRFYDVWIKKNSKWKAVSSQGTKVLE
ncbi:MAG TPA: nuclear transport factor 2 family protein [Chitinophagaceae bacterium]|nr:nuclear transport factor 2 family protein [Chitinophagaceae bacterium]